MPKFLLLDRDGVINRRIENGYVASWEQFTFLPGSLEALRLLAQHQYAPVVVSNQASVAKGLVTQEQLDAITGRFLDEVRNAGGRIEAVFYCPHRDEDGCDCRKPKPGLLQRAQRKYGFNFAETFMVGDSMVDMQAAAGAGCPALLIAESASEEGLWLPPSPVAVLPSLYEAAEFLVARDGGQRT